MTENELFLVLRQYGQGHILEHCRNLRPEEQRLFLDQLRGLDFETAFRLHGQFSEKQRTPDRALEINPASVIAIPKTQDEMTRFRKARVHGEMLLRESKVAVLVVAGGQGSRLGFEGPKGAFPVSPIRKKTLFQLFAEQVKALSHRYSAHIPLLVMTSRENHQDTVEFFESHKWFELDKNNVHFFQQGNLPSLTPEGKLILKDWTHLFMNPNGHGGSLKSLYDSGLLNTLLEKGFSDLFYFQVDNPLARIADPLFLGFHSMRNAEVSSKVVRRKNVEERVGVYVSVDGRDAIIEYSDLDPAYMSALDERGEILYWAGNTAIHVFSLSFVKRLNEHGFALPYHSARKTVKAMDRDGMEIDTNCWKFETFVFDAIPLAERTCCMEVAREEEFSPVKNSEGTDSPETARQAMINLYRSWLADAGVEASPDAAIEISPMFALDKETFSAKVRGKYSVITENTYFG